MTKSVHETVEQPIARRLVTAALEAGFMISVWDGEEYAVKRSVKKTEIVAGMFSTDEDLLTIRTIDGTPVGTVWLIYGNGEDVISDYTVQPDIERLVAIANREKVA